MPDKLMSCYRQVKSSVKGSHPDWSNKRVDTVARATCVAKTGEKFKKHESDDNAFTISFNESTGKVDKLDFIFSSAVKVKERSELQQIIEDNKATGGLDMDSIPNDSEAILVAGTAIYQTTTKNYNRYSAKELRKATPTLNGVTCQKDHSESMKDTFGKVVAVWNEEHNKEMAATIGYLAFLNSKDPHSELVAMGYVQGVSVAGSAEKVLCSICGEEFTWDHEHWLGEEYDGVTCEADLFGLHFRHLGFTINPAAEKADAAYIPVTLDESLENALVCMESVMRSKRNRKLEDCDSGNTRKVKFGEMNMSPEKDNNLLELEKSRYKIQEMEKEKIKLEAQLEEKTALTEKVKLLEERERDRLIRAVAEAEAELDTIDSAKIEDRVKELSSSSTVVLEAKIEVLQGFIEDKKIEEAKKQPSPKSRSFGVGNTVTNPMNDLSEEKKAKLIEEAKIEQMGVEMFGKPPSVKAVNTINEWDNSRRKWKSNITDLARQTPRGGKHRR